MIHWLHTLTLMAQIDSTIYELQKELELYRLVIVALVLLVAILAIAWLMQMAAMRKKIAAAPAEGTRKRRRRGESAAGPGGDSAVVPEQKELPDPGIIFRYAPPGPDPGGRIISIGRRSGSIKTWSTEINDDHLEIHIAELNSHPAGKLYELPERLYAEYRLTLKRGGNVLIHYPGLEGYGRMDTTEVLFIKQESDPALGPSFSAIEARQPLRLRLGAELGEWDRFINGYFEFHLYLQDHETENDSGLPKIEKYFMLRLYRIYPGYDISSPDAEGLYPMLDPFGGGR